MAARKLKKNEITDRSAEALEALELMLDENPDGVTLRDVWKEFGTSVSFSAYTSRAEKLVEAGLLRKFLRPKIQNFFFVRSPHFAELKKTLVIVPASGERPVMERLKPRPHVKRDHECVARPPAPKLREPDLLNGLPYTHSSELRTRLSNIIEGLEILQVNIGPTLALLLDLDRDFDRYTKVRAQLGDLKKQLCEVKL